MRSVFETVTDEARKRGSLRKKAALGTALPFVGRDQLLVGEDGGLQDIRADDPAGVAECLLRDLFLVDADGCHDLPLVALRGCPLPAYCG